MKYDSSAFICIFERCIVKIIKNWIASLHEIVFGLNAIERCNIYIQLVSYILQGEVN